MPKTVKDETHMDLLTYIQLQNIRKREGGPLRDIKKSHSAEKKPKGGPFRHVWVL